MNTTVVVALGSWLPAAARVGRSHKVRWFDFPGGEPRRGDSALRTCALSASHNPVPFRSKAPTLSVSYRCRAAIACEHGHSYRGQSIPCHWSSAARLASHMNVARALPHTGGRIELLGDTCAMACLRSRRSGTGTTLAADTRHFRLLPGRPAASATKGENVMKRKTLTRRRFVAASAAASASMMAAPFVRTTHAAGKLTIGLWDHWVPGANDASRALVEEWAAKEKVDVQIDDITSQGEKLRLVIAAELQAKSGHDILQMASWWPHAYAHNLEPVDDVVVDLIKVNGAIDEVGGRFGSRPEPLGRFKATSGSQIKEPCSRIDLMKQHAGIDVQAMYPAGRAAQGRQLDVRYLHQGGGGLPQGRPPVRHRPWYDSRFRPHCRGDLRGVRRRAGRRKGKITVKTDAVRQALDYTNAVPSSCRRMLPPGTTPPPRGSSPARRR